MPVESREEVLGVLNAHRGEFTQRGVVRCGLFGSFARGDSHNLSDVDVLVEFAPGRKSFAAFMSLSFRLEELLGRRVDLVTPDALSPYIGPHILREIEYVPLCA